MRDAELDSTDQAILRELQNDARLANKDLAARIGVAPSTALERVRALRRRGIITGFRAIVDPAALGRSLRAVLSVKLRPHNPQLVEPFRQFVLGLPETLSLLHVAGPDDYLIHVAVVDATHLQRLTLDGFLQRPEVVHLQTTLVFEATDQPIQQPASSTHFGPPTDN